LLNKQVKPQHLQRTKNLPLAPQIAEKLAAAEEHLADLQLRLGSIALADQLGEVGASEELAALGGQLRSATDAVAQLGAAHQRALEADAATEAAALRERQAASLEALEGHAAARLEVVIRLAASIEAAHRDFNLMRDLTDQMLASVPEGASVPPGLILEFPATLIAGEMFRHSEPGGVCLPGSQPPDFSFRDHPGAIEPAVDVVKRSNAWLVDLIRDQIGAAVGDAA
jgi:hypothetical protein